MASQRRESTRTTMGDGFSIAVVGGLLVVMLAGLIERRMASKGRKQKSPPRA
jgi:hypothetical protein